MAIVDGKSDLIGDYIAGYSTPDPQMARARIVMMNGRLTHAATDSNLSKWLLAELPSTCILGDRTAFRVDGLGLAQVNLGTYDDIDALITVAKSAGATVSPVAFGDAKHARPLWQVLGLAKDPGGMIGIYLHASANATAAGTMLFRFEYFFRN